MSGSTIMYFVCIIRSKPTAHRGYSTILQKRQEQQFAGELHHEPFEPDHAAYPCIMKLASTIVELADSDAIQTLHLTVPLQYTPWLVLGVLYKYPNLNPIFSRKFYSDRFTDLCKGK